MWYDRLYQSGELCEDKKLRAKFRRNAVGKSLSIRYLDIKMNHVFKQIDELLLIKGVTVIRYGRHGKRLVLKTNKGDLVVGSSKVCFNTEEYGVYVTGARTYDFYFKGSLKGGLISMGKLVNNVGIPNLTKEQLDGLIDFLSYSSRANKSYFLGYAKMSINELLDQLEKVCCENFRNQWSFIGKGVYRSSFSYTIGLTLDRLETCKKSKFKKYFIKPTLRLSDEKVDDLRSRLLYYGAEERRVQDYLPYGVIRNLALEQFLKEFNLFRYLDTPVDEFAIGFN